MKTNLIFSLIAFTNILINLDHGILPACTVQLESYFNIGQKQLGILGSIVYLGIIIFGLVVGRFYQKFNSKKTCLFGLSCMIISLVAFVLSRNYFIALASRLMTGGFQVFMLVYFPVWIDKFGGDNATTWITILQVGVPLGIFAGYGMTSIIIQNLIWQYSFYIQIGMMTITIILFILIKQQSLDVKEVVQKKIELQNGLLARDGETKKKPSYFNLLVILFTNKLYIISILTMSVMLFVSTGIQFWMTDYFVYILFFKRQMVNIAYAVVSITGPTLGVVFGGLLINKIGGYNEPKSIYLIFIFSCVGIGSGVMIPFFSNFYVVTALLWIVLFFGGAMVPGLTGKIMSSVQPSVRAFANSNGQIVKNTFGYFPSPFLYGLINSLSSNDRAGIMLIMFWGLLAPFLLLIGSLITYKQGNNENNVQKTMTEETLTGQKA